MSAQQLGSNRTPDTGLVGPAFAPGLRQGVDDLSPGHRCAFGALAIEEANDRKDDAGGQPEYDREYDRRRFPLWFCLLGGPVGRDHLKNL
jgi:hypothetical protein